MHRDSLSNDSGSILSLVFNQMCDDAEFALETPLFCLLPIPHTYPTRTVRKIIFQSSERLKRIPRTFAGFIAQDAL